VLCSYLAARALFETFAFLWDYRRAVTKARQSGTLKEFEGLTLKALVATKNPKWFGTHPEWQATNILTAINRLSDQHPGIRNAYDELSHRCHPNTEGTFYMFADLDEHAQCVKFSDHNENAGWAFRLVFAVTGLIIQAEDIFNSLEQEMPNIADELRERRFREGVAQAEQNEKQFVEFVNEEQMALQGDANGQFNLGVMYATGVAMVPKNLVLAYAWFTQSAAQGNEEAVKWRDNVARSMTAAQIVEARDVGRKWKPLTTKQIAEMENEQIAEMEKYQRERKPNASDKS
jgi:Sel1 repeat